jgi:hypothetical protein
MKKIVYVLLVSILISGCNFSKSVKKDLVSGLTSTGSGLTCEDVYLTVNNERTSRNTFSYGDMIYLVFSDLKGFTIENGNVFPVMEIVVTDLKGDTALYAGDLYSEYTEGIKYSPLELTADVTVATPIKSGGEYVLNVSIRDRKGSGSFNSKLRFTVEGNGNIKTEPFNVTYNEVYLFSQGNNKVINDGKIGFDDNVYIMAEGVNGFKIENGMVFPGLGLKGTDSEGNLIIDYPDLFTEYGKTGVEVSDFSVRVSANFKITGNSFKNPLHCEMLVWDKKSDAKLKITTDLTLE